METLKKIEKIISSNKSVKARIVEIEKLGYKVNVYPMGSGGVGQKKKMADGTTRVQVSYGWGRYNYAYAVAITP